MTASEIRKKIKAEFPDLDFRVRKVSFQDLARESAFAVVINGRLMGDSEVERMHAIIRELPAKAFISRG